jgi:outer membrane protein assembly factor BamB
MGKTSIALAAAFLMQGIIFLHSTSSSAQTAPVQIGISTSSYSTVEITGKWGVNVYSNKMLDINPREFGRCTADPVRPLVYCGADDGVFRALHKDNGQEIWSLQTSAGIRTAPAITERGLFLASSDGCIHRLNPETGALLWKEPYCTDNSIWGSPVVAGDLVYFSVIGNQIYAISTDDARFKFKVQREKPQFMSSEGVSEPTIDQDVLFSAFSDGVLIAANRHNGKEIWQADLSTGAEGPKDADATPVVSDGIVYSGAFAGGPIALRVSDGTVLWKANRFGIGHPVISNNLLIVADADGFVVAFDKTTGREIWVTKLDTKAAWNPVVINDYLIIGGDRGLWVLRKTDGAALLLKTFTFGVTTEPGVMGDDIYFAAPGGTINAATIRYPGK